MRSLSLHRGEAGPEGDKAGWQPGSIGSTRRQQQRSHFSQQRRRLPAYARELASLRRQGLRPDGQTVIVRLDTWPPNHHIGVGEDGGPEIKSGMAKRVRWPQIVCPPDATPADLDFSCLADLEVVAHWRSLSESSRLKSLLRCILAEDPRILVVLDCEAEGGPRPWFVKSMSAGVEVDL